MTSKTEQLLNNPHKIAEMIVRNQAKLEALKYTVMPHSAGYGKTGVRTDRKVDLIPEYVAKMDEIERTIKSLQKDYLRAVDALSAACEQLDEIPGTIIMYRYVHSKSYEEIAEIVMYSASQVYQLRRKGIEKLDLLYN